MGAQACSSACSCAAAGVVDSFQPVSSRSGTPRAANKALDSAEDKLDEWEDQLNTNSRIDDLAARAQDLANRGINYVADTSQRARRQLNTATDATCQYVQEQPGKSLVIAAAAGAAAALLVMLARGGRDDRR